MKICLINNIYPPNARGGAEQVVVRTVEGLLERGHEVVLITSTPGLASRECSLDGEGLTIYRVRPRNIFFYTAAHRYAWPLRFIWHVLDIFNLSVALTVKKIIRSEAPDVVHTHNLMGLSFLIPSVIRRLGVRHVHTVHDVQLVEPSAIILKSEEHSRRYTGWLVRLYSALTRRLLSSPTVVISPSQFLLDFYEQRGFFPDSHRVVLRNPVTFDIDDAPRTRDVISMASAAGRAVPFRFLYLGQIEKHKGVEILAEAFTRLAAERPDSELHIVGDGSRLAALKDRLAGEAVNLKTHLAVLPRVVFHGRVDKSCLPELFRGADLVVVPSLCYENSPTVIFESFAFGVPVLASNIEGIAELIAEGENGLTFPSGDQAALLTKMRWCLEHREAVRQMGEQTKQFLLGLSQPEYIARLTALYGTQK